MPSLIDSRNALMRPAAWRRMLVVVALIGTLIAGILAMHTIATSMNDHAHGESTASMAMPAITETTATTAEAQAAVEVAGIPHSFPEWMSMLACILALLFAALATVTVAARSRRAGRDAIRTSRLPALICLAAVPSREPPDLNVLSISRV